jgi:hypothetical protein
MLTTALEYQTIFDRLARQETLCATFKLTQEDWEFIGELCGRLKLFFDATKLLSDTNYITTNLFSPKSVVFAWLLRNGGLIKILG